MSNHVITVLALFFFSAAVAQERPPLYRDDSPVTSLNSNNFRPELARSGAALVKFYAPWCRYCTGLQPDYEKVAVALRGFMLVAAVNADTFKDLGSEFAPRGFPNVRFMYMENGKVKSVECMGRTAKDIIPWALHMAEQLSMKRIGEKFVEGGNDGLQVDENEL